MTQYLGELSLIGPGLSMTVMGAYGKLSGDQVSLFLFGALSTSEGAGLGNAIIKLTGLALGFGTNRRVKVPVPEEVVNFPFVSMIMGTGGLQVDPGTGKVHMTPRATADAEHDGGGEDDGHAAKTDIRSQLGRPAGAVDVLTELQDAIVPQEGQDFGCLGVRFTLVELVDCMIMVIVQAGDHFELTIIGVGRLQIPKEDPKPIAYIEIALEGDFDDEHMRVGGCFTPNSWILDKDCHLTGGFDLIHWFEGEHKGDFVLTVGGYNPHFIRPVHYPDVDRLGFNWQVDSHLLIKAGVYFAITPSAFMAGGRLEISFHSGPISAWLTAYADFLIEWNPSHYDIEMGIIIKVDAHLLFHIKFHLDVKLLIMGPPVYGHVKVHLGLVHFTIPFGDPDGAHPKLVESWQKFAIATLPGKGNLENNETLKTLEETVSTWDLATLKNIFNQLLKDDDLSKKLTTQKAEISKQIPKGTDLTEQNYTKLIMDGVRKLVVSAVSDWASSYGQEAPQIKNPLPSSIPEQSTINEAMTTAANQVADASPPKNGVRNSSVEVATGRVAAGSMVPQGVVPGSVDQNKDNPAMDAQAKINDQVHYVRGDEVMFAAKSTVPVKQLHVGTVDEALTGVPNDYSGNHVITQEPLTLGTTTHNGADVGIKPMGIKTANFISTLNVTVIRDVSSDVSPVVDMTHWTKAADAADMSGMAAATWEPDCSTTYVQPKVPSAKVITGCITGISSLKPPEGSVSPTFISSISIPYDPLDTLKVTALSQIAQAVPTQSTTLIEIGTGMTGTAAALERGGIQSGLESLGFSLAAESDPGQFRSLYAPPLVGSVTA